MFWLLAANLDWDLYSIFQVLAINSDPGMYSIFQLLAVNLDSDLYSRFQLLAVNLDSDLHSTFQLLTLGPETVLLTLQEHSMIQWHLHTAVKRKQNIEKIWAHSHLTREKMKTGTLKSC